MPSVSRVGDYGKEAVDTSLPGSSEIHGVAAGHHTNPSPLDGRACGSHQGDVSCKGGALKALSLPEGCKDRVCWGDRFFIELRRHFSEEFFLGARGGVHEDSRFF